AEGVRETARPTEIDGERGGVGPVGLEAARQRLEDGARAAADVEDARAGRELDPPVDHVLDDPQARDAPPVGLLDLIDRPTEDLVHKGASGRVPPATQLLAWCQRSNSRVSPPPAKQRSTLARAI